MNECVIWHKYIDRKNGYGIDYMDKKVIKAHRAAWVRKYGPIPNGLFVLHKCDVRSCVNTEHLFLGTQSDNMTDMVAKGRRRGGDNNIGQNHGLSKITEQTAVRLKMCRGFVTEKAAAKAVGISQSQAHDIMVDKAWKHVTTQTRYTF